MPTSTDLQRDLTAWRQELDAVPGERTRLALQQERVTLDLGSARFLVDEANDTTRPPRQTHLEQLQAKHLELTQALRALTDRETTLRQNIDSAVRELEATAAHETDRRVAHWHGVAALYPTYTEAKGTVIHYPELDFLTELDPPERAAWVRYVCALAGKRSPYEQIHPPRAIADRLRLQCQPLREKTGAWLRAHFPLPTTPEETDDGRR